MKPRKKPERLPPPKTVRQKVTKLKATRVQKALSRLSQLARLNPVKRANMLAYLEKRGFNRDPIDMEREYLALAQNLAEDKRGMARDFAISARAEARYLRETNLFLEVMAEAKKLRLY